jgi:hypothetical protein
MMSPIVTASQLCTAVYDGDMPLLRRLLRAGANPDAGDYDKRTPLHIAAAEGNLPAVSAARVVCDVGRCGQGLLCGAHACRSCVRALPPPPLRPLHLCRPSFPPLPRARR